MSAKIDKASRRYLSAILDHLRSGVSKADGPDYSRLVELLSELPESERQDYMDLIKSALATMATAGLQAALDQIDEFLSSSVSVDSDRINENAVSWAEDRAAELVAQIDETTQEGIRDLVAEAESEGWSNDRLSQELQDMYEFSPERAALIASTETARADVQGNLIGWKGTGVVSGKQWLVAQDDVCDDCLALDGVVVGLDEPFPGDGGDGPPDIHPSCRCDLIPVIMESDENTSDDTPADV